MAKHHRWIKMIAVDVKVIPGLDDRPMQTMLEDDIEKAVDEAIVGCANCNRLLNHETVHTTCEPPGMLTSIRAAFRYGFGQGKEM